MRHLLCWQLVFITIFESHFRLFLAAAALESCAQIDCMPGTVCLGNHCVLLPCRFDERNCPNKFRCILTGSAQWVETSAKNANYHQNYSTFTSCCAMLLTQKCAQKKVTDFGYPEHVESENIKFKIGHRSSVNQHFKNVIFASYNVAKWGITFDKAFKTSRVYF
jgi:hypothetical protein